MSEQRRMEYLDALGIEQFVPRKVLPGAKPSLALIRSEIQTGATAEHASKENHRLQEERLKEPASASVPIVPARRPSALGQPVAQLVEQVTQRLIAPGAAQAEPQPTRAPQTASSLVPPQRVLRFALTVWQVPGWLWIDSRQSQQALPTDALLHNLLLALNIQEPAKAEVINWPPVESPLQTQDWAEARDMLKNFLAPRLQPADRLILMGEAAYNACTQGPFDYAERLAEGLLPNPKNPCLLAPSLAQILRQPELKAGLWQQLKQLQQA